MSIVTGLSGGLAKFSLVFGDALSLLYLQVKTVLMLGFIICAPVWHVQTYLHSRPGKHKYETFPIAVHLTAYIALILAHVFFFCLSGSLIFKSLNAFGLAFSSEQLFFLPNLRFLDVYLKCVTHLGLLAGGVFIYLRMCHKHSFVNRWMTYFIFTVALVLLTGVTDATIPMHPP